MLISIYLLPFEKKNLNFLDKTQKLKTPPIKHKEDELKSYPIQCAIIELTSLNKYQPAR